MEYITKTFTEQEVTLIDEWLNSSKPCFVEGYVVIGNKIVITITRKLQ
jgi:hypothetical protein